MRRPLVKSENGSTHDTVSPRKMLKTNWRRSPLVLAVLMVAVFYFVQEGTYSLLRGSRKDQVVQVEVTTTTTVTEAEFDVRGVKEEERVVRGPNSGNGNNDKNDYENSSDDEGIDAEMKEEEQPASDKVQREEDMDSSDFNDSDDGTSPNENPLTAREEICEPVKRLPTILIMSNRRSGTHLTIDMLYNLFQQEIAIMKTNHIAAIDGELNCDCFNWLRQFKLIHAHRNVLDVVVSMYYYRRSYDRKYRESVTFNQYLKSHYLKEVLDRWVKTVHSWFLLEEELNILNLKFEDTIKMSHEHVESIAKHLDMEWRDPHNETRNEMVFDKHKWNIISHPVQSGRGKGSGGFKAVLSKEKADEIMERVKKHPFWQTKKPLTCPKKEWPQDEICTNTSTGKKRVKKKEHHCFIIGSLGGRPIRDPVQTYMCIPKSCPADLIKGLVVTRYAGVDRSSKTIRGIRK